MIEAIQNETVRIRANTVELEGILDVPANARGIILFAHGSGSSRFSPRDSYVAAQLKKAKFGTLLLDLLVTQELQKYEARFDISLLTDRLNAATNWILQRVDIQSLPIGLFGANTGTAAALQLAATRPSEIGTVVSRGGRPDMAGRHTLELVRAPTLLIVGGLDDELIDLNKGALTALHCEKELQIIPGATHPFEEPGKLEAVAELAVAWFGQYLKRPDRRRVPR